MLRILGLLMAVLASEVGAAQDIDSVDRTWRARGLQAIDRLQTLGKDQGSHAKDTCEYVLEGAFMAFANPNLSSAVISSDKKSRTFLVALLDGDHAGAQIQFVYEAPKGELVGARVIDLGEKWSINVLPGNMGTLIVGTTKDCAIAIDTTNPWNSHVMK